MPVGLGVNVDMNVSQGATARPSQSSHWWGLVLGAPGWQWVGFVPGRVLSLGPVPGLCFHLAAMLLVCDCPRPSCPSGPAQDGVGAGRPRCGLLQGSAKGPGRWAIIRSLSHQPSTWGSLVFIGVIYCFSKNAVSFIFALNYLQDTGKAAFSPKISFQQN